MDYYNLKFDWDKCKILTMELELDVVEFFQKPTIRKWAPIVRKKSKHIETLGKNIKKNILRQRQDSKSDYS